MYLVFGKCLVIETSKKIDFPLELEGISVFRVIVVQFNSLLL